MLKYRNNKKGTEYELLGTCINCTNAQDGQLMYIYKSLDNDMLFVREQKEFLEKFTAISNLKD